MISVPLAKPEVPPALRSALQSLGIGAAVTALADWLFYLHLPGISVTIFALSLAAVVLLTNPIRAGRAELAAAMVALVMGVLPSVEDFNVLSVMFAVVGSALFALLVAGWPARPPRERVWDVVWMIVGGPFRLGGEIGEAARVAREHDVAQQGADWLKGWVVPLAAGGVFLALFAAANPVIADWFSGTDMSRWNDIDWKRVAFWLLVIALIWGFLRVSPDAQPRLSGLLQDGPAAGPVQTPPVGATPSPSGAGVLFGRTAILRSLVLFNALFGVQTALDIAYLWGGAALPAGMTYASYAHRGAYPLIVTALLAAAFVLAAMRPGSDMERARPIRLLVFLWIAQNVMLVVSSMLRLVLYIDAYALTGLRCAAFIWMLLVAVGLVLIMARIAFDRSNAWLVGRNTVALVLTLYVCSFVDFPALIADSNVAHSHEATGTGSWLDLAYHCDLGPAAIPSLDALAAEAHWRPWRDQVNACRDRLVMLHRERQQDWRAFTLRGYRLDRYLDRASANPPTPPAPPAPQPAPPERG